MLTTKTKNNNKYNNVHVFFESKQRGDKGEEEIFIFLSSIPSVSRVIDVRSDWKFRKKDIDAIVEFEIDGKKKALTIEVKTDSYHNSGNLFFETVSNDTKRTPGCFMYSEADVLCYYFPGAKQIYWFKFETVRKWFLDNLEKYQFIEKRIPNYRNRKYIYSAWGRLVPKNILIRSCPLDIINLNPDLTFKSKWSFNK